MSYPFSKKVVNFLFGALCFLFLGISNVFGAIEILPESGFESPAYLYNPDSGIIAIPSNQANDYTAIFLQANAGDQDGFVLENDGNNLFNNLINDPDAILGYAWAERVGWIAFSHGMMQGSTKYYPHFSTDQDGSQAVLKGYVWSKYSGWIQLSSDNFETDNGQTENNWGVVFNGDHFSGKAWGAGLGWIDFSNVTYNATTGKFGGFACTADNCSDENNKIYFDKVPDGIDANAGQMSDWGVSRNLTSVIDQLNGQTCDLLSDVTCLGNSPSLALSTNQNGSVINIWFSQRLVQGGTHKLKSKITNRFGQTFTYINPKTGTEELKIKSVVWPMNCTLEEEGHFVCDTPNLSFSKNNDEAIADGTDKIELTVKLTNSEGEAIYVDPANNIFSLLMYLTFEDTVEMNQLDLVNSYDAVRYFDTVNNVSYSPSGNGNDEILLLDNNVNGEFKLDITSFAPTNVSNELKLIDFQIILTLDEDAPAGSRNFTFTKASNYPSQNDVEFTFLPALTAVITNFKHIIENTPSVFDIKLENHSPTQALSQINLNTLFEGIFANLIAEIKAKSSSSSYTNVAIDQLQLVSTDFLTNYLMFPYASVEADTKILSDSLANLTNQTLTFDLKPLLVLGDQIDPNESITFETEVAYEIESSNKHTHHDSHFIDLQNVLTSQIDIKGLASGEKIYDINKDYSINTSGSMSFGEISEEIRKNVADITRNETAGNLPATIASWTSGQQINNGKTLYYEGGDVLTIDGLSVEDSQGSIIVMGGDVYIKNDISYTTSNEGSFGLIVIKDSEGNGGNIYVDPNVTNLVGGYYAEGSMLSANGTQEEDVFDGFSLDKSMLKNQLFIQGTLISRNTIGGSRQTPVEYPETRSYASCAENSATETQKCAERFDLNYMRNFAVNGSGAILNGGTRANQTEGVSDAAFLIKYDPRIQTNIPPGFEMNAEINFEEIVL